MTAAVAEGDLRLPNPRLARSACAEPALGADFKVKTLFFEFDFAEEQSIKVS